MTGIEGQARARRGEPLPGALPPGRTFAALLALIVVVTAMGLRARPRDPSAAARAEPAPAATSVGDHPEAAEAAPKPVSVSARAVRRAFRDLRVRLERGVRTFAPTLVREVTTASGSVRQRSLEVVRSLRRTGIVDRTEIRTLSIRLLAVRSARVRLQERALLKPCLQTIRAGRDVTKGPAAFVQVILWRVRHHHGEWRLHRATLVRDRVTEGRDARC